MLLTALRVIRLVREKHQVYLLAGVALPLLGAELVQGRLGGGDEARHHLGRGVSSRLRN